MVGAVQVYLNDHDTAGAAQCVCSSKGAGPIIKFIMV